MNGGYRMPFDPRPLLSKLQAGHDVDAVWGELWQELHHQGDIGEASYAAVPHLVRIHRQRGVRDWNTYRGARIYGRILAEFSEDEILELQRQAFGDSE